MIGSDARGTTLEISVRPHAGRCRVVEASESRIRIEVSAPPEDGKATRQTLKTLADALDIPVADIQLLKGMASRHKTILVKGIGPDDCLARLRAAAV